MWNRRHFIRDLTGEYAFMEASEADSFAAEKSLEPLPSADARSRVSWWLSSRSEQGAVLRKVFCRGASGVFHHGAEGVIEDAFYTRFKMFRIPRPERSSVSIPAGQTAPGSSYVPPPAPTGEDEQTKTWFEVRVVDEFGEAIDGLEIVFSSGGREERLETNGAGIARWNDVIGTSFASMRAANVETLRELLRPRYANPGERTMPEGADVTKVMLGLEAPGKSLTAEVPGVLVIARPLRRVRLMGMHFDTNKCFLREGAMHGIRRVVSIYKANPTGKLLIVGHTDTTSDDAYNVDLSVERAEAVQAYLKDDVAAWEAWFSESKPAQKRWGNPEISAMIKALPCEKSVAQFQQWSNDNRNTSLEVDGIAGPKTRKALIEAYMAIDGTTLPKSIETAVHGCGEFFPRKDFADEYGEDNVESEENRRVEMFCFDDEINPPVPGKKGTRNEPEYPAWNAQVTHNVDVEKDTLTRVLRLYLLDHEYQRMPHTEYELRAGPLFSAGTSDENGFLIEWDIPLKTPCEVRWAPVDLRPPPDPGLPLHERYAEPTRTFRFRSTLDLDLENEPTDAQLTTEADLRLRNMGYIGGDFDARYAKFRSDYGRPAAPFDRAGYEDLARVHSEGIEAPPPEEVEPPEGEPEYYEDDGGIGSPIDVQLKLANGQPAAGYRYEIAAGSDVVRQGTLDDAGRVVIVDLDPAEYGVRFPELNGHSWESHA